MTNDSASSASMDPEFDLRSQREGLAPHLLALQRTIEADAFWVALQNLLDASFPSQSIIAALRVVGDSPPVFYHSHHRPHHTHSWITRTLAAHPCFAHVMTNPGTPVLRLSDVLPGEVIKEHPFHHKFMAREGWFHGMAFVFWTGNQINALISVNRSSDQPDFSDEELDLARWLHPQIEIALCRVTDLFPITDAHSSLVFHFADHPLPALQLCWNLKLIFANRAARTMLDEWRNADSKTRRKTPAARASIPRDLREACASLKQRILDMEPTRWPPPALPAPVHVNHPTSAALSAIIRPTLSSRRALSNPSFWIQFEKTSDSSGTRCNLAAFHLLTPGERVVADLLLLGLTNDEIASRLDRSVSTIKSQLQSSYRKLGVHNRTGMIAKLLSTP